MSGQEKAFVKVKALLIVSRISNEKEIYFTRSVIFDAKKHESLKRKK